MCASIWSDTRNSVSIHTLDTSRVPYLQIAKGLEGTQRVPSQCFADKCQPTRKPDTLVEKFNIWCECVNTRNTQLSILNTAHEIDFSYGRSMFDCLPSCECDIATNVFHQLILGFQMQIWFLYVLYSTNVQFGRHTILWKLNKNSIVSSPQETASNIHEEPI